MIHMCGPRKHHSRGQSTQKYTPRTQIKSLEGNGQFVCLRCGQTYSSNVNFCRKCGYEVKSCPISKENFRAGDEFAQCPNCHSVFHYHHLNDWLHSNKSCPMCRSEIREIIRGTAGVNSIITE